MQLQVHLKRLPEIIWVQVPYPNVGQFGVDMDVSGIMYDLLWIIPVLKILEENLFVAESNA